MLNDFVWPKELRESEPRGVERIFQTLVPHASVVRTVLVWPPRDRAKRLERIVVRPEGD